MIAELAAKYGLRVSARAALEKPHGILEKALSRTDPLQVGPYRLELLYDDQDFRVRATHVIYKLKISSDKHREIRVSFQQIEDRFGDVSIGVYDEDDGEDDLIGFQSVDVVHHGTDSQFKNELIEKLGNCLHTAIGRAALEVHKDMTLEDLLQRQPRCIKVGDVRFKRSPIKSKTNISYKAIAHIDEGAVVFEVERSPEMVDDTDECRVFLGAPLYVHPRVTWRSRDILLKDAFASVMRLLIGRKAVERHTSLIGDWLFEPATARVALEKQKDLLTQVIDARPRTLVVGGYKLEYGYNMCDEPDDIELVYIVKNLNIPKTLDLRVYFSKSEVDEGRHEAGEYARVVLYTAKDENFIDDEKVDDGPAFESGVQNAIASMIQKAKNYAKKVYARVSLEHENVDFQHVLDTAPKSFKFGKYKFELFKLLPENDPKLVLYISDKTYEGFDIAMVFSKFNDDVNFSLFYPDSHSKTLYQDDISLHASDREDKLLKEIDDGIKHLLDKERKHAR